MNKLIADDDSHYTDMKDILNCQKRFYQKLYEEVKITDERSIETILGNKNYLITWLRVWKEKYC